MSKRSSAAKASVTVEKAVPKFFFVIVNRATFPLLPSLPYRLKAVINICLPASMPADLLATLLSS